MHRIRTLIGAALAATIMLPALPAGAYAPFTTTTTTVQSQGDVGRRSAVALMPNGLPIMASWDATDKEIDVIACADVECSVGESHTIIDWSYVADFDIALGPDDRPVIVASSGPSVVVVKCGDLVCSSGNTTTTIVYTDWYTSLYDVSIDVGSDNLPRIAYSLSYWSLRQLHIVSCNDVACAGGDEHSKYLAGGTNGYTSDLVVDGGDRAVVAWSDGDDTYLTRCAATCASASTTSIASGLTDPSIAASGDEVSVVGRTGWNLLRKVDCTPTCAAPADVMSWNDRGHKADIAFVGSDHTVIVYVEPTRGWLEFIDCPSTCLPPKYIDSGAGASGSGLSIAGDEKEAYVSHPRGRANLGLTHIYRPTKPGWHLGK